VKSHFCYGLELLHHHKDKHLSDVSDVKPPISKHLLGEHLVVELCEEQQSKSCKLDVLCGAIDVSCVSDEQTKTDSGVDQSRMNIVTEVEQSEPSPTNDLGAETIATNSCKQSATDHFTEVEGDDADKTGSVVALLRCGVLNGDSPLYGLDIDNVNFPFPDEMPKIRFPVIPSTFSGGDLELEGVPPPVIIESSEFLGHLTVVDHRMFAVEFERLDIIDMFFFEVFSTTRQAF
jgi:hypothetical protein